MVLQKGVTVMKMSLFVKTVVFILLLIGAHLILGIMCSQLQHQSASSFPNGKATLNLLLWTVGSILLVLLIGGFVTTFIRPFWILSIGYFLSSLALLVGWGVNIYLAITSLLYFLIAIYFSYIVVKEIKERVSFSVKPIQQGQNLLVLGLTLLIGVSFALGYQEAMRQSGEVIPSAYKQKIFDSITLRMQDNLNKESETSPIENAMIMQQMQQGLEELWIQADAMLKPYSSYIPFIFGGLLICVLNPLLGIIAWLPPRLLFRIVQLLKAIGVVREVIEVKETKQLVLD